MPLIQCPDCKKEISDQAPVCPNCGRPFSQPRISAKKRHEEANRYNHISWLLFAAAILTALAGIWSVAPIMFVAALVVSIIYHIKR
jgi:predicted amidophosphoribosyltransferase